MVLASTDETDLVVDPFSGSGTTLRVCQQLNRNAIGIELNPDYAQLTKERLSADFLGFDSVDPRMERVPLDMRLPEKRQEYLENHKKWFLQGHENALKVFEKSIESNYGSRKTSTDKQLNMLE